nr:hypothetical protein [Arthrobacter sp. PAMC25564]
MTAFTAVSLDPPLVQATLTRTSRAARYPSARSDASSRERLGTTPVMPRNRAGSPGQVPSKPSTRLNPAAGLRRVVACGAGRRLSSPNRWRACWPGPHRR